MRICDSEGETATYTHTYVYTCVYIYIYINIHMNLGLVAYLDLNAPSGGITDCRCSTTNSFQRTHKGTVLC